MRPLLRVGTQDVPTLRLLGNPDRTHRALDSRVVRASNRFQIAF